MIKYLILCLAFISCSKSEMNNLPLLTMKNEFGAYVDDHIVIAKEADINYTYHLNKAINGNLKSLKVILSITEKVSYDAASAEAHDSNIGMLIRHLGDKTFSQAYIQLSPCLKKSVLYSISYDLGWPEGYDEIAILKSMYPLSLGSGN